MAQLDKEIGHRLRISRITAGFKTALEFTRQMNIPKSTYSQHESGKRSLTAEQLIDYADTFDIDPHWLLTGLGHPCPNFKYKINRKKEIDKLILLLQEQQELPHIMNVQISIDDTAVIVNMELLSKIIIYAFEAIGTQNNKIDYHELISFCTDCYNNIAHLTASFDEKEKIIKLSINSMLKGNIIFLKKAASS